MKIVVTNHQEFTEEQRQRLNSLGDVTYNESLPTGEEYLERIKGADIICSGTAGLKDVYAQLSVVVRSGTIARIRDTFKSNTEPFLVDTTVFPGNSGGPVVNKPESNFIEGTKAIDKASLIGIVASYVPYRDFAVSRQTQNLRVVFEENSGLCNVFSVNCIESAVKSFERKLKQKIQLTEPEKSKKATERPRDQQIQTNF